MRAHLSALVAAIAAVASAVNGQLTSSTTALNVVDIILSEPVRPQTCRPTQITWSWDQAGTLPSNLVALSIINATDFGSVLSSGQRRKRSLHRHFDDETRMQMRKRATIKGVPIDGADMLPFSDLSYTWPQVDAHAGQYRLLMTVLSSGQAVVSDPFIITGSDTSCLSTDAASATLGAGNAVSTGGNAASASNAPGSTSASSNATPPSTSSTKQSSIPTLGGSSSTGTGSGSSSGQQGSDDDSSSDSKSGSHSGAIAAGVIVPLLAIAAAVFGFFWYRKRSTNSPQTSSGNGGSGWSEKFLGGHAGSGSTAAAGPQQRGHARGISGPQAPTSAGLAAVAGMVPMELRQDKDRAALQGTQTHQQQQQQQQPEHYIDVQREQSPTSPLSEHWVDFADEEAHNIEGARPLSRETIESSHIGDYASTAPAASPRVGHESNNMAGAGAGVGQMYAQGRNIPLGSRPTSSLAPHDSMSTLSSSSPAHRGSNLTQGSVGRDLIAALPQPPSSSRAPARTASSSSSRPSSLEHQPSSTSPFADSAEATHGQDDTALSSDQADLQRSDTGDSSFGIKRKPVPRLTLPGAPKASSDATPPSSGRADPFADPAGGGGETDDSHEAAYEADAYDAYDAMETVASPGVTVAPATPPQPRPTPPSLPVTPASSMEVMHRDTPSGPTSVDGHSHNRNSNSNNDGQASRDDYHLSINLSQDNGFRVSFGS